MTQKQPAGNGATDSITERFNTVLPDLGSGPGWDQSDLSVLLTLDRQADGVLCSPHAETNINGALFGGQLIGQAISAAGEGLPDELMAHTLQLNFLTAGATTQPMRYEVRRLMSGRNFTVQQVLGTQGERIVVSANVSFHRPEPGPDFQLPMPTGIPDPESLPSMREVMERNDHRLPNTAAKRLGTSRTLDLRPLDAESFVFERDLSATFRYWVKPRQALPVRPRLHQATLGYISDYWFPLTALAPCLDNKIGSGLYVASLNHTLWFHRPVQADDWLFFDAVSPSSSSSRGLTTGRIYNRAGVLVATVAQESLFRGWVEREGALLPPGPPA